MSGGSTAPVVLIVDDEPELADLFSTWLSDSWTPRTAYDGEEALTQLDDSVDIVLLDRRMPGLSGDDVLEEIRRDEVDCRVVMVTAVDPDFDIIAMGFDDYLVKPVSKSELIEKVSTIHGRTEYSNSIQEFYSLVSKRAILESEKTEAELRESAEFQALGKKIESLRETVDQTVDTMQTHDDFEAAFRDIPDSDE